MTVPEEQPVETSMPISCRHALRAALGALSFLMALAGAAVAQGYVAQPGDVLRVEVIEDPALNREVLITPDGSFAFPFLGSVSVRGRSIDQIRRQLTTGLTPQFAAEPTVFVSVARVAPAAPILPQQAPVPVEPITTSVFVTGEIANQGAFEVEPGTTILQMIATAGGLTQFAAESRIELRRTDAHTGQVVRYRFAFDGTAPSISPATTLIDGDVIVVPERKLFEFN